MILFGPSRSKRADPIFTWLGVFSDWPFFFHPLEALLAPISITLGQPPKTLPHTYVPTLIRLVFLLSVSFCQL